MLLFIRLFRDREIDKLFLEFLGDELDEIGGGDLGIGGWVREGRIDFWADCNTIVKEQIYIDMYIDFQ
jgi:hypothetical protein